MNAKSAEQSEGYVYKICTQDMFTGWEASKMRSICTQDMYTEVAEH
jgi:hypothetical protein